MNITPEITTKIENLATIIDYGMLGVHPFACIKHYLEECDENDQFREHSTICDRIYTLGCQAYLVIYRDILNYTERQLAELSESPFDMVEDVLELLKLDDDDVVYSKERVVHYITKYLAEMIWDENRNCWHPEWK